MERHRTCTETPQQNGVVERMNRTLLNKVRCMLHESGLGKKLWAKATSTACYLVTDPLPHPLVLKHLKPYGQEYLPKSHI